MNACAVASGSVCVGMLIAVASGSLPVGGEVGAGGAGVVFPVQFCPSHQRNCVGGVAGGSGYQPGGAEFIGHRSFVVDFSRGSRPETRCYFRNRS